MGDVNVPCTSYMIQCYAAEISGMVYYVTCCYAAAGLGWESCCESEEENKVRSLCPDRCHWENNIFKKNWYGTTARRKKKRKTTLNAH